MRVPDAFIKFIHADFLTGCVPEVDIHICVYSMDNYRSNKFSQ